MRNSCNKFTIAILGLAMFGGTTYLYLANNQLDQVPAEMGQLVYLYELDLSQNQLSWLPEEIGQMVSLETLSLQDNRLTRLPNAIAQLSQLRCLKLAGNPLPPELLKKSLR